MVNTKTPRRSSTRAASGTGGEGEGTRGTVGRPRRNKNQQGGGGVDFNLSGQTIEQYFKSPIERACIVAQNVLSKGHQLAGITAQMTPAEAGAALLEQYLATWDHMTQPQAKLQQQLQEA